MVGILSLEFLVCGLLHQRNCKKHYIFALFCLPPTTSLFLVKKMESDFTIPEVLENLTRCYYPVVLPFKVSCLVLKTNSTKNGFVRWFFVTICILKSLWYSSQQQSPFSFFFVLSKFQVLRNLWYSSQQQSPISFFFVLSKLQVLRNNKICYVQNKKWFCIWCFWTR